MLYLSGMNEQQLLERVDVGIRGYLEREKAAGRIAGGYYDDAVAKTLPNLRRWLETGELDRVSPGLRETLRQAIRSQRWEELTNAFSREVAFGTGGIREKMGAKREEILLLKQEGIHAPIIKGPNTINDVTLLLTSAGVAKFGIHREPPLKKVVIGFDSRVRGRDFARAIASLFLAYDYTVYLFDEACSYPSITFGVPKLKADAGIFISASHNDFRYNGFKLSSQNGSQFDPAERKQLYESFIKKVDFADIKLTPLEGAPKDKLWFLGGQKSREPRLIQNGEHKGLPLADPLPIAGELYAGREDRIIDLHSLHAAQIKNFVMQPDMIPAAKRPLSIGFSAFNGSGRNLVPRMLGEMGFEDVKRIMKLDPLDGMFPAFCSDPGKEQQPDPGDWRSADIAVAAFKEEHGLAWKDVDLILGTDPDADRCGVIVKVPPHQRDAYRHPGTNENRDYSLISADETWTLILWYRLMNEAERYGRVRDAERRFIVLSHTTTDLLTRLARKHGLGVLKTWVGFAQLAAATRAVWDLHQGRDTAGLTEGGRLPVYDEGRIVALTPDPSPKGRGEQRAVASPLLPLGEGRCEGLPSRQPTQACNRTIHSWEGMESRDRSINVGAFEQSNGFTILGGPPVDERSLGQEGHVRDKDGIMAAVLVAELMQYAKEQGYNLFDLIDEKIYLDPDIGLYITHYEPDPLDGEYEGLAGYTKKRDILTKAEDLFANWQVRPFSLGGLRVQGATVYRTGKYDSANWAGFPDEGFRFYFDADSRSHLTIRPSGTSNALRFHVQLFGGFPSREALIQEKAKLRDTARRVVEDIKRLVGIS
jgi:phosphomannomutase